MADVIDQILFSMRNKRFQEIEKISQIVSSLYSGNPIVREGIFSVVRNYARKNEIPLQIFRYPFHDDKLWAFTFLKKGTIFICINSGLPLCRQFFATAHELYHIYCFGEDTDQNTIRNGSLLKSETIDTAIGDQEELEANAFAGLTLMPTKSVRDQIDMLGIDEKNISLDDVLVLMDVFAIPYKACVLRLYECGVLSHSKSRSLYAEDAAYIQERMSITGRAKRWQLDGEGTELFGSLLDDFFFNVDHEFLTESRERSDRVYISSLKDRFNLDVEEVSTAHLPKQAGS